MDKGVNVALLLDMYGKMLTAVQFECLDMYYNRDLSLSEIADNVGKTRQGVYDSIKRGESFLLEVEDKLGFLKKTTALRANVLELKNLVKVALSQEPDISENLKKILEIVQRIDLYSRGW